VKTICAGLAASAAALILLAPRKENRPAMPNSRIMLHQPSMSFQGSASDIDITAKQIIKLREQANRIISEATGVPLAKVAEDTLPGPVDGCRGSPGLWRGLAVVARADEI